MTPSQMVREFHEKFGLPIETKPHLPEQATRDMRTGLLEEEADEYLDAEDADDFIEIADALGDMVYVIFGTALSYGIDLDAVLNEIHRSNMTKLGADGKPVYRADGKVVKGPNYEPPRISHVLYDSIKG